MCGQSYGSISHNPTKCADSGGFKGWPGVAWPPHLKAHSHLYSSTTGMNRTDLYRPSEIISPTSLLCPLSSLYVCRPHPQMRESRIAKTVVILKPKKTLRQTTLFSEIMYVRINSFAFY